MDTSESVSCTSYVKVDSDPEVDARPQSRFFIATSEMHIKADQLENDSWMDTSTRSCGASCVT